MSLRIVLLSTIVVFIVLGIAASYQFQQASTEITICQFTCMWESHQDPLKRKLFDEAGINECPSCIQRMQLLINSYNSSWKFALFSLFGVVVTSVLYIIARWSEPKSKQKRIEDYVTR